VNRTANPALTVFAVGGQKAQEIYSDDIAAEDATMAQGKVDYIVSQIAANYAFLK
jgi:hypothetical protein